MILYFLQEKTIKLSGRLELVQKRYKELERRRTLEAEGFKTDVRMLRNKLKDLEKQLLKVQCQFQNCWLNYMINMFVYAIKY